MAAGNVRRIIRGSGRVVIGPTDLSNVYPHGGTEIGQTTTCMLQSFGTPLRIEYESLGEAGEVLEANKHIIFTCFVRGWDDDSIEQFFSTANYSEGSKTRHAVLKEPGSKVPGEASIARAVILLYVPDDPIHVPALLIYRGIPSLAEGAEIAWQRGTELGLPITVECLRDGNDLIYSAGRLADLSLTS